MVNRHPFPEGTESSIQGVFTPRFAIVHGQEFHNLFPPYIAQLTVLTKLGIY